MPESTELSVLELTQQDGALLTRRSTIILDVLEAEIDREIRAYATRPVERVRAFNRTRGAIADLKDAARRALDLLQQRHAAGTLPRNVPIIMVDVDARSARTLDAAPDKNLDWWLRATDTANTLVEIQGFDPESFLVEYTTAPERAHALSMRFSADPAEAAAVPTAAEVAAAGRRALFNDTDPATKWMTSDEVSRRLGSRAETNMGQYATSLRQRGKLLGVWSPDERGYRFPPWQFRTAAGGVMAPIVEMAGILKLLREHGGVIDGGRHTSGWNEVEWFMTPHVDLDGATPIERLVDHPDAVLQAAQAEFLEDADAAW